MRSTAAINGHPIHPILIAFPVAFGVGAPAFDIVGVAAGWPTVWTTGAYLSAAAVISGLVAGVPGFVDYLYTVPPNSSAKSRATWHMCINVTALALIALGWLFRDLDTLRPANGTIALEVAGIALLSLGGWLGGVLVFRNQIGVDHRYARAGKWNESNVEGKPGTVVDVATTEELQINQMKLLHVDGRRIVLARTERGYAACDDRCTHRGGSLAGGVMTCGIVCCPWHGSQFDVTTGEVKAGPAEASIRTYQTETSDGKVRLIIPSGDK